MIPGDPFRTDELDDLRSSQRRILNWIPPWVMEQASKEDYEQVPAATVDEEHRTHAELVFRRFIDAEVLEEESDLIARMRASTEGQVLRAATAPLEGAWNDDLAEIAIERSESTYMGTLNAGAKEAQRIRRIRRALLTAESLVDPTP